MFAAISNVTLLQLLLCFVLSNHEANVYSVIVVGRSQEVLIIYI